MTLDICYPPGADWSCSYTATELTAMRAVPETAAAMGRADALAWMQLAALTADQLGTCPVTVRPCSQRCLATTHTYYAAPVGYAGGAGFAPQLGAGGQWYNGCGCATGDCSCTALCEAILPGPVGAITEVRLGGAVLSPTAYRVDNGNRLVRTDGDCWPACQDMAAPGDVSYPPVTISTGIISKATFVRTGNLVTVSVVEANPNHIGGGNFVGTAPFTTDTVVQVSTSTGGTFVLNANETISGGGPAGFAPFTFVYITPQAATAVDRSGVFEVSYYRGAAPAGLALYVAGLLAVEYYKACISDKSCRLPARLQSVARQGVSYQVAFDDDGTTGIREVDDYVRRLNPHHLTMAPVIVSPQSRRVRTTTWSR